VLDELAAVLLADAVEHLGGVEGAGDGAGPAFVLEHPTEQHGEDFVRVDEVAVLVGCADAVGVAVGAEAGLAAVGDGGFAEGADVRLDGLGVDAGKERVGLPRICTWATPMRVKMSERMVPPRRTWSRCRTSCRIWR
jgi:hypothetical protein